MRSEEEMCLLHISKFRKKSWDFGAFHPNGIRAKDGNHSPRWSLGIYLCLSALESIRDSKIQINFCDSNSGFR